MAVRQLTTEEMQKLWEWHNIQKQIKDLQAVERPLRDEIAALLVPSSTVGTHRFAIAKGVGVKVKLGETVKLSDDDPASLQGVYAALVEDGLTPEEAGSLVKTELKLSVGAYNKLSAKHQALMAPVVEIKPSAPTIEIEAKMQEETNAD